MADNFVPVGGGDAVTAVGYKSELSNNVTVRYSFFSYNRSLDVSVGPFSPLEPGIDRVHHHPSCFLTSSNVVGAGDNFTLPMTPSFLKFSLVITTWPWLAPYSLPVFFNSQYPC